MVAASIVFIAMDLEGTSEHGRVMLSPSDISVIICTYSEDRWDDLVAAMESVKKQTTPAREIIVVVDHNARLLERMHAHVSGVVVVENQRMPGASGARNCGVAVARGKIIAFLDDDAVASSDWIEQHCAGYDNSNVLGVGGKTEPLWQGNQPRWFPEEFYWVIGCTYKGMPEATAPVRNLWTCNMSVRRDVFEAINGFRVRFGKVGTRSSPEDTDLCIRALQCWPKGQWRYKPCVRVKHRVQASRANWQYYLRRCYNEGIGKAQLASLVGAKVGMSDERKHLFNVLPKGVLRGLDDALFRRDTWGLGRSGAILVGTTVTFFGYLSGLIITRLANSDRVSHDIMPNCLS